MIRLITRGRFNRNYVKGLLAVPEDRTPYMRKVIEAAGGKLVNFYFTTGDSDFLLVTEANEAESVIGTGGGGHDFRRHHFKSLDR